MQKTRLLTKEANISQSTLYMCTSSIRKYTNSTVIDHLSEIMMELLERSTSLRRSYQKKQKTVSLEIYHQDQIEFHLTETSSTTSLRKKKKKERVRKNQSY